MSEFQPPTPPPADPGTESAAGPAVGQDEWVARAGERRAPRAAWIGGIEERLRRVPWWAWLTLFVAAGALMPAFESSGYVRLVAFETVIYMVLALGLNLIVGWAGLLDLGYIAYFGVGSYVYAIFDSPKFGYHVPADPAHSGGHDHRCARRASALASRRGVCQATTSRS